MTDPSPPRFPGRCSLWLSTATAVGWMLLAGAATGAQSDPPSITAQPQSLTVTQGMNASFSVTASGATPLEYQWFRNATNLLEGATNFTLSLSNVLPANAGT